VAVVGVPDPTWGETGHAFVILEPDWTLSGAEVMGLCQGKLAKFKWPSKVTFVTEFPRTSLGKVRKEALRGQNSVPPSLPGIS
jgi:acyl-CoA synthetase (AMP-forming)/AMP-acid ligase II